MIVLSHRGLWKNADEKNTRVAFERSFHLGFGTETDIRDYNGHLVISHDIANERSMPLEVFFDIYNGCNTSLPLALNIKADGLQAELKRLLTEYHIENYFVFDMAVPDGLLYAEQKFRTFTRHSEYEPVPPYYELAQGVWLDEFKGNWLTENVIERHLAEKKDLCIVSPELHKRNYQQEWQIYRQLETRIGKEKIMLCTDFPEQAKEYFNE